LSPVFSLFEFNGFAPYTSAQTNTLVRRTVISTEGRNLPVEKISPFGRNDIDAKGVIVWVTMLILLFRQRDSS
jgi:hypothetical protein